MLEPFNRKEIKSFILLQEGARTGFMRFCRIYWCIRNTC